MMARHQPDLQPLANLQMRKGASGTSRPQYRLLSKIHCFLLSLFLVLTILLVELRQRINGSGLVSSDVFSLGPSDNITLPFPINFHTHTVQSKLTTVSCRSQIASRNVEGVFDPNHGMAESPKRLTITHPPFWISLHKEYYDKLRWVSIMDKGNYYETGITEQFHQILANTTRVGQVLDVGMNIGWFTLWARALGHSVAGFEPNPIMHTRLCESLELNKWQEDGSVQIFPYGLGEEEATLNLTTGLNPGSSSFHPDRLAKKFRKSMPVKVVKLDSIALQEGWLDEDSPPIHLMKVDVEGYEPFVFRGGMQLLQSGRVQNIIMENSLTDLRQITDFFATISRAGYKVMRMSNMNGDPYHPEMLPQIEKELTEVAPGIDLGDAGEVFKFFSRVKCNLWWTKR